MKKKKTCIGRGILLYQLPVIPELHIHTQYQFSMAIAPNDMFFWEVNQRKCRKPARTQEENARVNTKRNLSSESVLHLRDKATHYAPMLSLCNFNKQTNSTFITRHMLMNAVKLQILQKIHANYEIFDKQGINK